MSRRKRNNRGRFSLFVFQDIITCVMGIMLLITLMMCLQITSVRAVQSPPQSAETLIEMQHRAKQLSDQVEQLEEKVARQGTLLDSGVIESVDALQLRLDQQRRQTEAADTARRGEQARSSSLQTEMESARKNGDKLAKQKQQEQRLLNKAAALKDELSSLSSGEYVRYNRREGQTGTCWLIELQSSRLFLAAQLGIRKKPRVFRDQASLFQWILKQQSGTTEFFLLWKPDAAEVYDELLEKLRERGIPFGLDLLPEGTSAIDMQNGAGAP